MGAVSQHENLIVTFMIYTWVAYDEEAVIWLQVEPRGGPWSGEMLLPSPEATEELPMNPFRSVRHPARLPEQYQHSLFHEGQTCMTMLPKMLQRIARPWQDKLCAARALYENGV